MKTGDYSFTGDDVSDILALVVALAAIVFVLAVPW